MQSINNSTEKRKITRLSDKSTTKATYEVKSMNEKLLRLVNERKYGGWIVQ
ncbi:hypothetical protein ACVLD2_004132 [Paenibacillus sp. PvR052]|nr:hypothetical protein [Paenibacillus sp. PvP091]MBP1170684.1 hypothetical protein [Paenibacillus sp. PvR098]MBP2441712.1 hypothetical protein [Paenibacillus sp. PvP052]